MLNRNSIIFLTVIVVIAFPAVALATTPGPNPCMNFPKLSQANPAELANVIGEGLGDERRNCAAMKIDILGPDGVDALSELLQKSPNASVRANVAMAIPGYYYADRAVPALMRALYDGNERVRAHAAYSLAHINHGSLQVIGSLADRLSDTSVEVSSNSAQALSEAGFLPEMALTPLVNAIPRLERSGPYGAGAAVSAISHVQSVKTLPTLAKLLGSPEKSIRRSSAVAMTIFGDVAIPLLQRQLAKEADIEMHNNISAALEMAKRNAADPLRMEYYATDIKALERQARDPSPEKRMAALKRFEHLLPAVGRAEGRDDVDFFLRNVARFDPEPEIRATAQRVLYELGRIAM